MNKLILEFFVQYTIYTIQIFEKGQEIKLIINEITNKTVKSATDYNQSSTRYPLAIQNYSTNNFK